MYAAFLRICVALILNFFLCHPKSTFYETVVVKLTKKIYTTVLLIMSVSLIAAGVGFSVRLQSSHSKEGPKPPSGPTDAAVPNDLPPIQKLSGNWWESEQAIYFNIPARILIKIPDDDRGHAHQIFDKAWLEFERIGQIFNPYDAGAEVARINKQSAVGWINVSSDFYQVLKISQNLWKESNGQFDPTFLPIKQLWRHAEQIQEIPSDREILKTLQKTGVGQVMLEPGKKNKIRIDKPGLQFDFGGIAKGYAVDQVRQMLKKSGITDGLVQLGGEIAAFGRNDGAPWRIGVQHPQKMGAVWGILQRSDNIRVSTSGNYRQPLMIRGQSFYHIFNPETGKPVSEKVLGVTTVGLSSMQSNAMLDGAATAITVMGAADGLKFASKIGIEALILTQDRDRTINETMTAGFLEFYHRQPKSP